MTAWRSILTVILLFLLAGCSATPEEKEPDVPSIDEFLVMLTEQTGRACITMRDIDTHEALGEEIISVTMRRGEHYLLALSHPCRFLGRSSGTLVSDSWGTLCSGGMGVVSDNVGACPIRHVFKFPTEEAAMATLKVARARREAALQFPDEEQ
ncbi:MAG: hypothetical protein GWM87_11070 [Xanthomonadales bacterium]|nr:hypothetical protein [Xanthomonadales bacterium]NIX13418.1 hypothetical protein [Xanthomonadales bacterium]